MTNNDFMEMEQSLRDRKSPVEDRNNDDLSKLLEKKKLDGVDYNWEYPGYAFGRGYLSEAEVRADYEGLHRLLEEIHAAS